MVLLVLGSAFTRRRALRSSAPRSIETANGPAFTAGPCTAIWFASRPRSNAGSFERIDMRNLFYAYRDRAKPPRLALSGRPLLAG
jgi:hypothetical protein